MKAITVTLLCSLTIANAVVLKLGPNSEVIEGSYIVKLKDSVNPDEFIARTTLRRGNGLLVNLKSDVRNVYNTVFKGFAAQLDDAELKELDSLYEVEYIEPDQVMRISQADTVTQNNADWGLARHSSKAPLSGGSYSYRYDRSGGSNARVYVIDTGILTTHVDYNGRAIAGANFIAGESNVDLNGHGTHCAGTVGSSTYGVAKNATLIGVKVLSASGSGSTAGVISGIEWSVEDARANPTRVNVLSLSLGGSYSAASNAAVAAAVLAGFATAVAAGNFGSNACNYSPASEPLAITVAASTITDSLRSSSNFGSCCDIVAPGKGIMSTYIGASNTVTATMSGTSMATPHVAGLLAYIGSREGLLTNAQIEPRLYALALNDAVSGVPAGMPNRLTQNELSQ